MLLSGRYIGSRARLQILCILEQALKNTEISSTLNIDFKAGSIKMRQMNLNAGTLGLLTKAFYESYLLANILSKYLFRVSRANDEIFHRTQLLYILLPFLRVAYFCDHGSRLLSTQNPRPHFGISRARRVKWYRFLSMWYGKNH